MTMPNRISFNAKISVRTLAFAAFALAITPPAAMADGNAQSAAGSAVYYDASDGNQRINLSGRLRMLSQRIAGMACNYGAGIEADLSRENLRAAVEEYQLILHGLEHGSQELSINGPETSLRVLGGITNLQTHWAPVEAQAQAVLAGDTSQATLVELAASSAVLLTNAQALVGRTVEFHYDRVNTIASEAFTVDFAGRQRMLAQRMSKNICLIHEKDAAEIPTLELIQAQKLFDATLRALQDGMPAMAIGAPPNTEVTESLQAVAVLWDDINPRVQSVVDGERLGPEARTALFHDLNALTVTMNTAVQTYVRAFAPAGV